MSSDREIHGDTANLKASQARALARLYERSVPADQVIAARWRATCSSSPMSSGASSASSSIAAGAFRR